jgi:hypothetical protein
MMARTLQNITIFVTRMAVSSMLSSHGRSTWRCCAPWKAAAAFLP